MTPENPWGALETSWEAQALADLAAMRGRLRALAREAAPRRGRSWVEGDAPYTVGESRASAACHYLTVAAAFCDHATVTITEGLAK